jgi:ribosomal protein S14
LYRSRTPGFYHVMRLCRVDFRFYANIQTGAG